MDNDLQLELGLVEPLPSVIDPALLDALAGQLVWKIGKEEETERIVVRVGYASATRSFGDLPKLYNAGDQELLDALRGQDFTVEWIE
jgi:hypothetical protein